MTKARGSVVGWGTMPQAGRSPIRIPNGVDFFQFTYSFQPHDGPGVDSASNRNKIQEFSWGKKRPARRADNLAAIYEPNVWKGGNLNFSQP
jgi:hypothetical protein